VRKEKLCLVVPSLHAGGMERVMSQLAFFFCRKDNIEVHLVLYGRDPVIFYNIPGQLIVHQPAAPFNAKFRKISTLKRLAYLRHEVQKIKPDAILSFGEYWNTFVILALYGVRIPVFVSDRCQPGKDMGRLQTLLRNWLYPRTKGIVAQTSKAREVYENQFRHNNIKVIGNPISIINDNQDPAIRENIVLTVGRLIKSKNHDRLIELFINIGIPGWKLIIVGDDAQKQNNMVRLQSLVKSLNAEERVVLAGNQSDVGQYYSKSRIFAFTSESEGFPNVIGEAQSYGLPVVAFDCTAGPSDLIRDNSNGFLIPLFDYDLFQHRLRMLMEDQEMRTQFGAAARESVREFSLENIGEQFYNFIFSDR